MQDLTDARACDNAVQENKNGFRLLRSSEWELAARYKGSGDRTRVLGQDYVGNQENGRVMVLSQFFWVKAVIETGAGYTPSVQQTVDLAGFHQTNWSVGCTIGGGVRSIMLLAFSMC